MYVGNAEYTKLKALQGAQVINILDGKTLDDTKEIVLIQGHKFVKHPDKQ